MCHCNVSNGTQFQVMLFTSKVLVNIVWVQLHAATVDMHGTNTAHSTKTTSDGFLPCD